MSQIIAKSAEKQQPQESKHQSCTSATKIHVPNIKH